MVRRRRALGPGLCEDRLAGERQVSDGLGRARRLRVVVGQDVRPLARAVGVQGLDRLRSVQKIRNVKTVLAEALGDGRIQALQSHFFRSSGKRA